jgi:UTP--glucose-1-phosphate uridylyltransferase
MKIRKCIIPVAGYGTRFLPATKAQPKEMLPIIDKPIVQYIIEEAVASGLTEIILVTTWSKRSIEDHFDYSFELEQWLKKSGKHEAYKKIRQIAELANFTYVRQKGPAGNATAVLSCEHLINDEPFVVVFGDDLFIGKKPRIKQLLDLYQEYQHPIITAMKITREETANYGVIDGVKINEQVIQVKRLVEKPGPQKAPSLIGSLGGYVLTPDIFEELHRIKPGKNGEYLLIDAIQLLLKKRPIYAKLIEGKYYDVGSKFGYLKANIEFGLRHPETSQELKAYLKQLAKQK